MMYFINLSILIYFIILWIAYTVLFISAIPRLIRKYQEIHFSHFVRELTVQNGLDVTVLMSVRNDKQHIQLAVDAVLQNQYPHTFLIVVNDGSTDDTLKHLIDIYKLKVTTKAFRSFIQSSAIQTIYQSSIYSHFLVIDKKHQQRVDSAADGHNCALNLCRTPLCVTIDADTIIQKDAILQLVYQYLSQANCIAVGGDIYIPEEHGQRIRFQNIPWQPTLGVQVIEYLRSFIYGHEFMSSIGGALCHSGALTLFETQRLQELGGFDAQNFSYDAEMIMRMHHDSLKNNKPYQIVYAPAAFAWSLQPQTIKGLWAQRRRWQRGLLRSIFLHAGMFFNPCFGRIGIMGMPFYVMFEIFGPVIEGCAYLFFLIALWVGEVHLNVLIWYLLCAWAFIFILSVSSLLINYLTFNQYYHKIDLLKVLYLNFVDILFYRPVRAFCALTSTCEYVFNRIRGKAL